MKKTTKTKEYKIVLSKFGKSIFKGGNIEVMQIPLKEFTCKEKDAKKYFTKIITESVGSGSLYNYDFEEIKKHE